MSKYKPYLAMICVHSIYAGMALLTKAALNQGMNHFVFVAYRQAMAAVFLAPFALLFERNQASSFSFQLFCKVFLVSLIGIALGQNLYMIAMTYTSPTLATATSNSVPVFTFILAVLFRMEIFNLKTIYGQAKLVGLIACLAGGVILALYKGPSISFLGHPPSKGIGAASASGHGSSRENWIIGSFLMLISNLTWSLWLLMQAPLLKVYPFNLSLTSLQCLVSAGQSAAIALAFERNLSAWRLRFDVQLLAVVYCGVIVTGVTYWLQVWCIAKKGPVFTAIFTPLSLVITIIFSCFLFVELFYLGSGLGSLFMLVGLYCVLWGKTREENQGNLRHDEERPKEGACSISV